jgi:D-alanyl-lipoteichoic acid acyltransferase DltB (MBOAT superfamily)
MIFNSIDFAIFCPVVFFLYWFVFNKNLQWQNGLVAITSYFFYGWWDWRFLFLLFFSTAVDFIVGLELARATNQRRRKAILLISIVVNLGLLGFFKYYNFFVDSFVEAFSFFGNRISPNTLDIILPVGISFYTFQTLSYSIDVYRNKIKPTRDFIAFAAFVTFFPQLVAGPIERATNLLPQFFRKRTFDQVEAVDGLRQILWGLFKKIVIADNCANYANTIFNDASSHSGATLALGAVFFAIQIYGDFSGYSDIAIGTSRLFGFDLMQNFAFPYFSRDIGEFWRRWHISLSTWFRDYVYVPLGGSRGSLWTKVRNIFAIFLISGFWHGANWTFIVWGGLNAIYFLPLLLQNKNRQHLNVVAEGKSLPSLKEFCQIVLTFGLTTFAWIFFRSESVASAFDYCKRMMLGLVNTASFHEAYNFLTTQMGFGRLLILCLFFIVEWMGRGNKYALEDFALKWPRTRRLAFYYCIIILIVLYPGLKQEFIYFQF